MWFWRLVEPGYGGSWTRCCWQWQWYLTCHEDDQKSLSSWRFPHCRQRGCVSSVTAAGRVSALLLPLPTKAAGSCVLTSLAACAGDARPLCGDYVIADPPLPPFFFHSAQPVDFGRHVRLRMRGRLCFSWMHGSSFQQVKWLTASGLKSQWRKCLCVCCGGLFCCLRSITALLAEEI